LAGPHRSGSASGHRKLNRRAGHLLLRPLTFQSPVLASAEFNVTCNIMNSLRSICIVSLLISAGLIFTFAGPARAAEELISGSIQKMMSPEEFKAAGLNKLSPEELQKLDAWLQGYRETTEKTTEQRVTKAVRKSFFNREPTVSRVDGSFAGLKGRTLIKLEDGTVWKQANTDDHAGPSPIDHPGAAVVWNGFGYKMRIQGVPEFYVNPVKTP
jgi:hypothetical protein